MRWESYNVTSSLATVTPPYSTLFNHGAPSFATVGQAQSRSVDIEASAETTEEVVEGRLSFCQQGASWPDQQGHYDATLPGHTPGSPAPGRAQTLWMREVSLLYLAHLLSLVDLLNPSIPDSRGSIPTNLEPLNNLDKWSRQLDEGYDADPR